MRLHKINPWHAAHQRFRRALFSQHANAPIEFEGMTLSAIRAKCDAVLAALDAEEAALRLKFSRPKQSAHSLLKVSFSSGKPGSSYALDGDAELDEPFGYVGASCVYIPSGGARDIARLAGALFCGPPDVALEASLFAAAVSFSGRGLRVFLEDAVDAAWREDVNVWWPPAVEHENVFKRNANGVSLFMSSNNLVDFTRQTLGVALPSAVVAVTELKKSSSHPCVGLPQAFIAAGSAAQHLRALGLPLGRCIVPLALNTGVLEQHGVAYLLDNDLPCFVFTSEVIDLLTERGRRLAVAHRRAMRAYAEETISLLPLLTTSVAFVPSRTPAAIGGAHEGSASFAASNYFIKTPAPVHGSSDRSHLHVLAICEKIQRAREESTLAANGPLTAVTHPSLAPVLPVARLVRLPPGVNVDNKMLDGISPLVFPRLGTEFQDARTPPPPQHQVSFFCALIGCVRWLHKDAGIIHGDLVPANVMWTVGADGVLTIHLVDFDAALPLGAPVSSNARDITSDNGFVHVNRE